jgi:1-aminocyclopropane-1-carboxylate deaminase
MDTIREQISEDKIFIQTLPGFAEGYNNIEVSMLRLDLLHPIISGNKWYKLKHNIAIATTEGRNTILSFGGAYSNHLIATAAAAQNAGLKSIGMVRGLHAEQEKTQVLQQCAAMGMELHFLNREEYSRKAEVPFLQALSDQFNHPFIIPEGGANDEGRVGAGEIAKLIPDDYTHICLSVGTATTLIGLRNALPLAQNVMGFAPMKGGTYLNEHISHFLLPEKNAQWSLTDWYHFGGFGKVTSRLYEFMGIFYADYGFPLDKVYTAKMMFGIKDLIPEDTFDIGSKILCIHTGGLTGN